MVMFQMEKQRSISFGTMRVKVLEKQEDFYNFKKFNFELVTNFCILYILNFLFFTKVLELLQI